MSEYLITKEQIKELDKAHGGMKIVTSWLSCYAIWDTSNTYPVMKSEHVAVDLPEIVRCRDCVRYSLDDYGNTWCAYVASAVQPDDFCAWGERKEGDSRG